MKLEALSTGYHDFYAPTFVVRLDGSNLIDAHKVAVSQVEVDLELNTASHFSFTLSNCYDADKHEFTTASGANLLKLLHFGAKVEIFIGYRDVSSLPLMLTGIITEVSINFPEGGSPEIAVSGMDNGFLLTIGKNTQNWQDQYDSDVVTTIAAFHKLDSTVEKTSEKHKQIEQSQTSDWDFLKTLAERNKQFVLFVDERNQLHFVKRNNDASDIVELVYGRGLLSFKADANLSNQVSRVEVRGWDRKNVKAFVGIATAGEESGGYWQERRANSSHGGG